MLCAGCPSAPPAPDATLDGSALDATLEATPDTPQDAPAELAPVDVGSLTVMDDTARVELSSVPLRVRVLHPDGTVWFQSPDDRPFLDVGAASSNTAATTFLDPSQVSPRYVQWRSPRVTARTPDGQGILLEDARVGPVELRLDRVREGTYRVRVNARGPDAAMLRARFRADDAPYYGLGERFGALDARGQVVPMQLQVAPSDSGTNEAHVPVPFFLTPLGYGVFAQTREAGAFDVGAADRTQVTATFQGSALDLVLFANPRPAQVVAQYAQQAGLPRRLSRWVYGHQQWRNEWSDSSVVLADAARLRTEHIPTTTIWIDNPWEASYNDHVFDTRRFSDPPALLSELARRGFRSIVWSTPYLDRATDGTPPANEAQRLEAMAEAQRWLVTLNGSTYTSPSNVGSPGGQNVHGAMLDFTAPGASEFWTSRLQSVVQTLGLRGFKLDYGEDLVPALGEQRPGWGFSGGATDREVRSLYPQLYHRAYRDALDRYAGGDGFLLVRASSWGGQSVTDVIWPGDLDNDFTAHSATRVGGLPAALHGMLSLATSGFAYFASDTGGYRGGTPTREVLLRWAEHSSLALVMQLGGGGDSHNPWQFDAEATRLYAGLARLHTDLTPYLRDLGARAATQGLAPVLPLALAYPEDRALYTEGDAYLLGDDLLVAPVVTAGATTRAIHLPRGRWIHWFTGQSVDGPTDLTVPAPLGQPVLFARGGALVPLLASDVDTLVSTDATDVVDEGDRASLLRVRAFPTSAMASTTREDGTLVRAATAASAVNVDFTPGSAVRTLRAQLDWAHREGATGAAPASVQRGSTALAAASSAMDAQTGCTDCWFYESATGTLWLSLGAAGSVTAR